LSRLRFSGFHFGGAGIFFRSAPSPCFLSSLVALRKFGLLTGANVTYGFFSRSYDVLGEAFLPPLSFAKKSAYALLAFGSGLAGLGSTLAGSCFCSIGGSSLSTVFTGSGCTDFFSSTTMCALTVF
jgi:hypothetical protein